MSRTRVKAGDFRPLRDKIFVTDLDRGVRKTAGGVIIPDDNMRDSGIRPRWARVWALGPEVKGLMPGEWVLIEHGRWTNGFDIELPDAVVRLWMVDPAAVLISTDEDPKTTQTISL